MDAHYPLYSPAELRPLSRGRAAAYHALRLHIRRMPPRDFDAALHAIAARVTAATDCTACGNCCRENEPPVLLTEIGRIAAHTPHDAATFRALHLRELHPGEADMFRQQPCMFLRDCRCSIYADRPAACADYPHLHHAGQKYRYHRLVEEAAVCPIVYHCLEHLLQSWLPAAAE